MGTLTEDLFGDDLTRDIAADFDRHTLVGKAPGKAAEMVLRKYGESLRDPDEGPSVILALASLLLDARIREHEILDLARKIVDSHEGLERWREAGSEELLGRKAIYEILAERLKVAKLTQERVSRTKSRRSPQVGDVVQIPLPTGQFAYGHYVHFDDENGPMLQIASEVFDNPVSVERVNFSKGLFPPVICGVGSATKEGIWQIVGSLPVSSFKYPLFKYGLPDKNGVVQLWWLWDGHKMKEIGSSIPEEYQHLEMLQILPAAMVEDKIVAAIQ